jgi:putative inorganic carbon (HCO3(-)) transporter
MGTSALGLRPASRFEPERILWPLVVLGAAVVTAGLTLWSIQAAITAVVVLGLVSVYLTDRTAGIVGTLAFWWIAPGLRRIVQWKLGFVETDPLSLAPFLATGGIVALELLRSQLHPRAARLLAAAALAFAIGLPMGLVHGPFAAAYALFGYLAAIGFAVVGYREGREGGLTSLRNAIRWVLPVVALYAIVQGALLMPPWDQSWLDTVQITSIGVGDGSDATRAFATLNAPGTLAGVLGVGLAWFLAARRPGNWGAIAVALFIAAIGLTYVRGAWIGLILAALAHVVVTRGRSFPRVAGAVLATVVVVGAMAGANSSAGSLVTRVSTLGSLNQDTSAQTRVATPTALFGSAATSPAGEGLGTTGEASRLGNGQGDLRYPDNAYLALIVQSGPLGLLIMLGVLAAVIRAAWRLARRPSPVRERAQACFTILVFILVFMISGDHFYGAVGVCFWLVVGYVLGLERFVAERRQPSTVLPSEGTAS